MISSWLICISASNKSSAGHDSNNAARLSKVSLSPPCLQVLRGWPEGKAIMELCRVRGWWGAAIGGAILLFLAPNASAQTFPFAANCGSTPTRCAIKKDSSPRYRAKRRCRDRAVVQQRQGAARGRGELHHDHHRRNVVAPVPTRPRPRDDDLLTALNQATNWRMKEFGAGADRRKTLRFLRQTN